MEEEVIAANLGRLRRSRNLTQKDLAARAGLSVAGYRNIETGKSTPRFNTVQALADALGVGVGELFEDVHRLEHVRFRSKKKLRTREQILADVSRWLHDYRELEEMLGEPLPETPLWDLHRRNVQSPAELAKDARSLLDLEEDEPIFDIGGLLEEKAAVRLWATTVESDGFFGLSVAEPDSGPAVVVNTWVGRIPPERWIFSATHELGHLLLHFDTAYDIDSMEESKQEEKEANEFAAHFLMPDDAFRSEWDEARGKPLYERVMKVKRIFRVSYKTVLLRLAEVGGHELGTLIARFQAEHRRRRGSTLKGNEEPQGLGDEPERLSPIDFSGDRLESLVRQAVLGEKISVGRAGEILRKSLPEMRELVRDWEDFGCTSPTPAC